MKKLMVASVLVASLTVSYFFAFFLPQYFKEKEVSKKTTACRKLAEDRFEKNKKEVADIPLAVGSIIPWAYQVHYNSKLNECIYYEECHEGANFYYYLYDLYSNRLLNSYSSGPGIPKPFVNPNIDAFGDFLREKDKLFEESKNKSQRSGGNLT
jgi:hypothetical protein